MQAWLPHSKARYACHRNCGGTLATQQQPRLAAKGHNSRARAARRAHSTTERHKHCLQLAAFDAAQPRIRQGGCTFTMLQEGPSSPCSRRRSSCQRCCSDARGSSLSLGGSISYRRHDGCNKRTGSGCWRQRVRRDHRNLQNGAKQCKADNIAAVHQHRSKRHVAVKLRSIRHSQHRYR